MFTEKHLPESLSGEELDVFLEYGWYRMGQSVFTCHFLFFEDNLYSPIWLRLPLEGYRFRKSLRKIKRRVEERFEVKVRPAIIDEEKEMLFQRFKKHFKGKLYGSVKEALFDGKDHNVFNTWEVAVFDQGRLIAFSFFDLGHLAIASIKAVYAHEYSNYSLGIYTMLREIQFGWEKGFDYFYPGYFVPGYSRFDYKLRIGTPEQVEFYDLKTSTWRPLSTFDSEKIPVRVLNLKLFRVGFTLSGLHIPFQMLYYPAFESSQFGTAEEQFLQSPLFLHIFSDYYLNPRFVLYYDLRKDIYVFSHSLRKEVLEKYLEEGAGLTEADRKLIAFMMENTVLARDLTETPIVNMVKRVSNLLKTIRQRRKSF